jgi:rhodanese-related sulfurtransferase
VHQRLLVLPDEIDVYPTHGAGSFCGAGGADAGGRRTSTLGQERRFNPLLRAASYQQFLTLYLQLAPYPAYYNRMRPLNRRGAPLLGRSLPALRPLNGAQVAAAMQTGAVIVDARPFASYDTEHIPNSLSVPIDGPLSAWVGWVLTPETPLVLLAASPDEEREAQRELLRIGYDTILGSLEGGMEAWRAAGYSVRAGAPITMADLAAALAAGRDMTIVDSRELEEWAAGHIPGSVSAPVSEIPARAAQFSPDAPLAVHCAHGYRSAIAASLFERAGFAQVSHVTDGYDEWRRHWSADADHEHGHEPE